MDGPDFGDACRKLDFNLDFDLNKIYPGLLSDASELKKIINEIDDIMTLGNAILSKWRGITHWLQESVIDRKNREWFTVALNRLVELTDKRNKKYEYYLQSLQRKNV